MRIIISGHIEPVNYRNIVPRLKPKQLVMTKKYNSALYIGKGANALIFISKFNKGGIPPKTAYKLLKLGRILL